ncbi:hypothetical protein F8M41_017631 [Gigaspora margarita]|uniref:Uncharacterized protein n=1 Tax=Gigaspora margarita TaxID=4874 RepID=A0A8H4EUA1_GIGMA|nr:hypothetical protein F8M41_017631 [Gigaspora margarita]
MMKLSILSYYFTLQYLLFYLLITLTKSQQLPYKSFNYTESKLGDQDKSIFIADIKIYDDETIIVHILRNESKQIEEFSNIGGINFEQLRIRLIFLNWTIKEIDPELKLDPINYFLFNSDIDSVGYKINKHNNIVIFDYNNDNNTHKNLVNPITIYPLIKPFTPVTYVKTKNSFDPGTYEECGEVIDWDGNVKSIICFNPRVWNGNTIQLNANKKLGFIRFTRIKRYDGNESSWNRLLWQHYSNDEYGNLISTKISSEDSNTNYSLITIVPTVENGYLEISNYTKPRSDIIPKIGLCGLPISYNKTKYNQKIVIYQAGQPINLFSCDETDSFIYCIVSIHFNNETVNGKIYEKIEIYSDQRSLKAKMTSPSDLIFDVTEYNTVDNKIYYHIYYYNAFVSRSKRLERDNSFIITNYFSINAVIQNHTFLLASPNIIDDISWPLLTIPSRNSNDYSYDNFFINNTIPPINTTVNSSTAFLNITFNQPFALSASTSDITIYKASDKSIRQRISTAMHDFLDNSSDGFNVAFKEYDEQYLQSSNYWVMGSI